MPIAVACFLKTPQRVFNINRHVAKDACIGSFISVDRLEKMVIAEIKKLAAEYLDRGRVGAENRVLRHPEGAEKNVLLRICMPTRERPLSIPKASGNCTWIRSKGFSPRTIMWRCPGTLSRTRPSGASDS